MPYAFHVPTTSHLALPGHVSSNTHPSLPLTATTYRGIVRHALKKHKRLPTQWRASHLADVLAALSNYIPYLLAIDAGLSGRNVAGEYIDIVLEKEIKVEWRATLKATIPGREPVRIELHSLEYELLFTLSTLASTHYLLARSQLHSLYNATTPTSTLRTTAISTAMKHLLDANSIYNHMLTRSCSANVPAPVIDISPPVLSALAALCLAEATVLAVLKDDPYPAAVAQDRNKHDKDWMFKALEMPKVRAHLFARLCLAAADHAGRAQAMLERAGNVSESLPRYMVDLKRTARSKACRLLGIDAEMAGDVGIGIAWLKGAKRELGFMDGDGGLDTRNGFAKLKKEWKEKREDKKVERGGEWGSDAGRLEEGRVVEMLLAKWTKMNDTVSMQLVPPSDSLLASMPSGREYHTPKAFEPPSLDESVLARMRAPPDPDAAVGGAGDEDDSNDEDPRATDPVGAFPGTRSDYAGGKPYY